MREVHCSACDAIVPAGSAKCPGCNLPLTATAQPAVYLEEARWPFWPIVLGALFLFFLIASQIHH